jgi:undecaprenyl pyrophosphate phosphatase UppP
MDSYLLFASGLTITLLATLAVVRYLSRPLRRMLLELCGIAERAEFWRVFWNVTVILTPAIFATLALPDPRAIVPAPLVVTNQVKWGLIGLVISVLMLGWILGRAISRMPSTRPVPYGIHNQGGAI